jgi:biopolymer transport protein ExbD/biopolymer transport protein TolR
VAVTRDGKTFLGNTQVPADQMTPKVKDLLVARVDKEVFLRADSRARYEKVVEVVNNLRAAGVDQLGLLTEQIQEKRGRGAATPATGAGE